VEVIPDDGFSARFPAEMPADLEVTMTDGTVLRSVRSDYEGFHTSPMSWEVARAKFDAVAAPFASFELREEIATVVRDLEHHTVRDLTRALARVNTHVLATH
jgi:2-methylcitrate dehydratase